MQPSQSQISLTKKQTLTLYAFRIGLFCMLLLIGGYFAKEMIFPTYVFDFRSAVDSLANTISRPYITEFGTTFDLTASGEFTTAHITITLPDDAPRLPKKTILSLRHSYRAFLAPVGATKYIDHLVTTYEIDGTYYSSTDKKLYPLLSQNVFDSYLFAQNTAIPASSAVDLLATVSQEKKGFASGTLVKSNDGIFVIDGDTKHPIQDEFVFSALGYNFANVRSSTNEERGLHKKARLFDLSSTHPFGTIFYARDADRTYIYDHDQLNKIEPTVRAKENAIIVDELSRTAFDTCILSPALLRKNTYTCTIPFEQTTSFPGNIYQFMIDVPHVTIEKSRITLSTAPTHTSLEQRLTSIKKELSKSYLSTP
ncbi:MAG: hypothetical protein WC819_00115 [Parcubacteria group bacterium]|jgi:hypothetical protein